MPTTSVTTSRLAWGLAEVASALGVSLGFLRKEIRRGSLKAVKVGRRVLILDQDLKRYLEIDLR